MKELLNHIVIVIVPLVISNSLHMVVVRKNMFAMTNEPIWDWGFGKNKTWRGFVFVPAINAVIVTILVQAIPLKLESPMMVGFVLGIAYMLAELPNSFLKRRVGILPGEHHGGFSLAFSVLDKTDSAIGVVLTYVLMGHATWQTGMWLLLISASTHAFVSLLLVAMRIKSAF